MSLRCLQLVVIFSPWLSLGCAAEAPNFKRDLMAHSVPPPTAAARAEEYHVRCPDVLHVSVPVKGFDERLEIAPDGRIRLNGVGRLRVEGLTLDGVRKSVADALEVSVNNVHVRVVEYKSQHIYVFGQVAGLQRAVPYQGPEPVSRFLQRIGGITADAASDEVYVVRPHIGSGKPPEVFHIKLRDIVAGRDQSTNIRLQPFDEVHIGESRKCAVDKCVPTLLQPAFEIACSVCRSFSTAKERAGAKRRRQRRQLRQQEREALVRAK
ncbi:MAG: hypothetical protein KatS3mg105_4363 [Gemmatales bacterium]|nr:MAG: hypothetical protein KatS3mg105_4363 [Gemmatales bacterium]